MADTLTPRRATVLLLAVAWLCTAAAAATFAWKTAGAYVRQNLRPLPGEADLTARECQAVPDCAAGALDSVTEQLTLLRQARALVHVSSWAVIAVAVIVLATVTVLVLSRRHAAASRTARLGWKLQAAIAALLLAAHVALLTYGAGRLTATPEPARLVASTKAFEQPFTDIGHLYYLAWVTAVASALVLLTWAVQRSLPD